jgi:hypothetical protein
MRAACAALVIWAGAGFAAWPVEGQFVSMAAGHEPPKLGFRPDEVVVAVPGWLPWIRDPTRGISPRSRLVNQQSNDSYSGAALSNSWLRATYLVQFQVRPPRPVSLPEPLSLELEDGPRAWCERLASIDRLPRTTQRDLLRDRPLPVPTIGQLPAGDRVDAFHVHFVEVKTPTELVDLVDLRPYREGLAKSGPPSVSGRLYWQSPLARLCVPLDGSDALREACRVDSLSFREQHAATFREPHTANWMAGGR